MSIQLLDKTRKINKLLQSSATMRVDFKDIANVMSDTLSSNVLIISNKGKVLAIHEKQSINKIDELLADVVGEYIDSQLNERILNILSTKENINFETLGFSYDLNNNSLIGLVIPVEIAGKRFGSIFIYRDYNSYDIDDIILGEYGSTVIGLEIMRCRKEERIEQERKVHIVKSAIGTLSYSEHEAIKYIFNDLEGIQGVIIASRVADKVGITRSVIVNALRKFESAGVIETRSLGMKGTYIKVLNDLLVNELK